MKCKSIKARQTRKIQIHPEVLLIQIKRFVDKRRKNSKYGGIPMKLHDGNKMYTLIGTVEHSGALNSGHYKSKCWNEKRGKWYMMDDDRVETVRLDSISTDKAYMLFYSLKDNRKSSLENVEISSTPDTSIETTNMSYS